MILMAIASFGITVHERTVNGVKTQAPCPTGLVTLKITLENFLEVFFFFFPCMENMVITFVSKAVMRLKRQLVHSKAFRVEVFLEACTGLGEVNVQEALKMRYLP